MGTLVRRAGQRSRVSPPTRLPPAPPLTPGRWALAALLALVLFLAGMEVEAVFAALTQFWQVVFRVLGLAGALARWQQGTNSLVTTRSLPAVGSYSLLYAAGSILLLHVLLRSAARTRWVVQVYLGLFGFYALLTLLGKLGGLAGAYRVARHIIDFLVSPLPVMLLLPLLWPSSAGVGSRRLPRPPTT